MNRAFIVVALALVAGAAPLTAAHGCNPSQPQTYGDGRGGLVEVAGKTLRLPEWPSFDGPNDYAHKAWSKSAEGGYSAQVADTNLLDCNLDGIPADYDGHFDVSVGGAAFGYGAWANDPICDWGHHASGPSFIVNDVVFGTSILVLAGEDDQSGPTVIYDASGHVLACEVSGTIAPSADPDDCLTPVFVGIGTTCGSGGGDGLYWVFLPLTTLSVDGSPEAVANPPTFGTIEAF